MAQSNLRILREIFRIPISKDVKQFLLSSQRDFLPICKTNTFDIYLFGVLIFTQFLEFEDSKIPGSGLYVHLKIQQIF